jgi:hypothetical protein
MIVGANNISNRFEYGQQIAYAKEIIVHEKWDPMQINYNHDIALIRLDSPVKLSVFVHPICLVTTEQNLKIGKVIGWGTIDDRGTLADLARIGNFEILNLVRCLIESPPLTSVVWEESFCAKSQENGVCKGDSGSGFFVEVNGKNYLKGIVSSSVYRRCNDKTLAIYTDMPKYFDFIKVN